MLRRRHAAVPVLALSLLVPSASAATRTIPSSSAVDQYVEVVPDGSGGVSTGGTSSEPGLRGASQASLHGAGPSSPVSAVVTAIASGDDGHVLGLAGAMVVIAFAVLYASAVQHRGYEREPRLSTQYTPPEHDR